MRARLLLLPLLLLAACGSSDEGVPAAAEAPTASAFPVTVEHAFGETTVEAEPERIVTIGLTEQDTVLALGHTPIAVTEWYGEQPHATWPWAQDELGEAEPEVLTTDDGIQIERIAALEPDLIIGTNAGLDETTYGKLSAIAPTIAHGAGQEAYFSPWDLQARAIGAALGQPDEAEALVADIEQQFAEAARAHPELADKEIVFLQNAFYDGEAIAYQEGLSTKFLTDLGFAIPEVLDRFVREAEGSQAFIPLEELSVLDEADVLMWATESPDDVARLEEQPLYNRLRAVQEGRLVFTDGEVAGAIYFTSPLSLPYVLERLVPALADAVEGDGPATAAARAARPGKLDHPVE